MSACTNSTLDSDEGFPKSRLGFLSDTFCYVSLTEDSERHHDNNDADVDASQKIFELAFEEIMSISTKLEALVSKLNPTQQCLEIHHKLRGIVLLQNGRSCFDVGPRFWNTSLK